MLTYTHITSKNTLKFLKRRVVCKGGTLNVNVYKIKKCLP